MHGYNIRSVPLSMNKLATKFKIRLIICNPKYQNNKTLKKCNEKGSLVILRFFCLSAMHRLCIPAGAIVSSAHTLN